MFLIILGLDKVTDLSFDGNLTENRTASIHFKYPRGYYDEIRIDCVPQDQHCQRENQTLTNSIKNCTNCTSISIHPVVRGVKYKCQASTIKESFNTITSDDLYFNTSE